MNLSVSQHVSQVWPPDQKSNLTAALMCRSANAEDLEFFWWNVWSS
jgi:hypothetical protein